MLALVCALAAIAAVLLSSGSTYVLHAEFTDAGQLVSGDLVTVAGHRVGSIGPIRLTNNGLADVELDISDGNVVPLRQGTLATIGQLSLTGVANRFVALTPGAGAPIPSGGVLPPAQTRGIVDLDSLIDSFTPPVRSALQQLFRDGAYLVSGSSPSQYDRLLLYLDPALSQSAALGAQVLADRTALQQLIAATARVSIALARPSTSLGGAVSNTAATLNQIASERGALADSLARSPATLSLATAVLGRTDRTLAVLDPALKALQPVVPRLGNLLSALAPATAEAVPTVAGIQALVPGARTALAKLPAVARVAVPAVRSLTAALRGAQPMLSAFRVYTPDVVAGLLGGLGGSGGGAYDANGHYVKSFATIEGPPSALKGVLGLLGGFVPVGPLKGARVSLLSRCPGGGGAPAADGSSPWANPDVAPGIRPICNPADDQR